MMIMIRGATKRGWRVLKHPQPKKGVPCNSARSDDFFLLGGVLSLALLWTLALLFHYSLLKLTRIKLPACLYFKIHRQLTIVEVLSEGALEWLLRDSWRIKERQKDRALSDRDGQMIGEKLLVRQIHVHMYNGSHFTRNTANLELEMFVIGENLLKERMNTKSPRVTNAALKTLRRSLLLKPN